MTNVVIASQDPLAQRLQTFLRDRQGFVGSLSFGSDLLTPAERIANALDRDVIASTTDVYGQWGPQGYAFQGNFVTVAPNADLTNLFDQMSLDD